MTALLMITGVLLVGVSALLLVRALMFPRSRFQSHLRTVDSYGFAPAAEELDVSSTTGSLNQSVNRIAEGIGRTLIVSVPRIPALRRGELTAAGFYELSREALHGYRALATIFFPALILLYAISHGGLSVPRVILMLVVGGAGWQLPALYVRQRARSRLNEIDRDLPQFIDLLVATIEAGSAFGGALSSVTGRFHGPLGAELRLTMRQQSLGIGSERALSDMVERCDTPSLRAFVRTIIRAESHGSAIGPVMRHLASDIRQRRRAAAREKIQKAPIKMIFPLAFLILPALLLVIMFPALYNVVKVLGHG
jgi:pilus assembly protein TadC